MKYDPPNDPEGKKDISKKLLECPSKNCSEILLLRIQVLLDHINTKIYHSVKIVFKVVYKKNISIYKKPVQFLDGLFAFKIYLTKIKYMQ